MASRGTASDRLQRILFLLPAAGGDGAAIGELADSFGVSSDVVLADLNEVAARAYYHSAGPADALNVYIEADRVRVRTTGDFRRPTKLDPREALALSLGVRVLAGDRDPETRAGLLDLAGRLENDLASVRVEDFEPAIGVEGEAGCASDELRGRLSDAVDGRRAIEFEYLKSNADEPETRRLEPYALVGSAGLWYVIGHDRDRVGIRAFRADRMLGLEILDEAFDEPADFDLDAYLSGTHVYRADDGVTATVCYAPSISRWILEGGDAEEGDDGEAILDRHVADPDWVIRHILRYGGEAELVTPPELRADVVAAARAVVEAHAGA
ncbi:MAG: WYL domain-containing protein [Gemmatimonadota bacterium]|nr:WYL domain-containing protein [Gemmatimonadota bacterium]